MLSYEEIFCSNIPGGLFDGALGITIELGGNNLAEVAEVTSSILSFGMAHILRITGDPDANENNDIRALISTLKDNGYVVQGCFDGKTHPSWMEYLTYRIVTIDEEPWEGYAVNELHYSPKAKVSIRMPILQPIHSNSILYIDAHRDLPPREMFDFILKAPSFRIFSPPSKIYRIPVEIRRFA